MPSTCPKNSASVTSRALDVTEDSVSYALRLLRTAGLVVARKHGRIVYNRLADDFPAPLRNYCLRQLIALTYHAEDTIGLGPDLAESSLKGTFAAH